MARKTKRERKRVIVTDDCFFRADDGDGKNLRLTAYTKSEYQYVVDLSGLSPSKLVWAIERLSERAAFLLRAERDAHLRLERRMQAAAKRVSDATKGGA